MMQKHTPFKKAKVINAFSIDFEDWYQGVLQINYSDWPRYQSRIERNLITILELLSKHCIRATFFILGYIADKFPEFVKLIAANGHEIASHGYYHRPVFEQTPEEFRQDVLRSKKIIESVAGVAVQGYRAPFFSITKKTLWALNILKEAGFKYDSSIFPTKNFLYGIPDAPQTIYKAGEDGLIEFPLSVIKRSGITVPVCGGFYMRMLPYALIKWGISSFNRTRGPAVIYLHPWELDLEKPKINIPMPLKWKIIYGCNIKTMKKKIEQLMREFRFTTISEVLYGKQREGLLNQTYA
jgi:polysaccharide deacetylase family protein (PEP-CTERM system associated)